MDRFEDLCISITNPSLTLSQMSLARRAQLTHQLGELEGQVFDHFNRTCRFCGFQENSEIVRRMAPGPAGDMPPTSLLLIPINGDIADLSAANLGVACIFCQAVNSLNTVAQPEAWSVIYLPGLPQYYLSWVARSVFLISIIQDQQGQSVATDQVPDDNERVAFKVLLDALRAITQRFNDAQQSAAGRYKGFGNVTMLSQSLIDMAIRDPLLYQNRNELLAGFRIVPTACIDDDWSYFFKYRTMMIEASSYSGLRTFKDIVLVARQAYKAVYDETFPFGDPLQMEGEMGTKPTA